MSSRHEATTRPSSLGMVFAAQRQKLGPPGTLGRGLAGHGLLADVPSANHAHPHSFVEASGAGRVLGIDVEHHHRDLTSGEGCEGLTEQPCPDPATVPAREHTQFADPPLLPLGRSGERPDRPSTVGGQQPQGRIVARRRGPLVADELGVEGRLTRVRDVVRRAAPRRRRRRRRAWEAGSDSRAGASPEPTARGRSG